MDGKALVRAAARGGLRVRRPGAGDRLRTAADRLLLGVPAPEAPGLAACATTLVRVPLLTVAALLLLGPAAAAVGGGEDAGRLEGALAFCLCLELGRWSFARGAADRARAHALFAALAGLSLPAVLVVARAPLALAAAEAAFQAAAAVLALGARPRGPEPVLLGLVLALVGAGLLLAPVWGG